MKFLLRTVRPFVTLSFLLMLTILHPECFAQSAPTLKVSTSQRDYFGRVIAKDSKSIAVLRTNGRINFVERNSIDAIEQISTGFSPIGASEIQAGLRKEFGSRYDVSNTGHFVVVHPREEYQLWAEPFEKLFHQLGHYFANRGIVLEQPEFPMVAVVLNSREEFDRFLKAYVRVDPNIQGYYSPLSNRIITYREPGAEADFFQMATVIHEATHQVAYNTGLHSRTADTPLWVSEGLAKMFEARGVHSSYRYNGLEERINRTQLEYLQSLMASNQLRGKLVELVQEDSLFDSNPQLAYALAWGLTFYLCETHSSDYSRYMNHIRNLPPFQAYTAAKRLGDFQHVVCRDLNDLELRMVRYLSGF